MVHKTTYLDGILRDLDSHIVSEIVHKTTYLDGILRDLIEGHTY